MAHTNNDVSRFDQFGVKARFHRIREVLEHRAARRAAYNRTARELQALSDRELADFGYHRSEIPRIAQVAAARA